MVQTYSLDAPASARNSPMANVVKSAFANACITLLCIGGAIAVSLVENRGQEQEQDSREFKVKLLHETYLTDVYNQINRDSFGGQLSTDVLVSWADLRSNPGCGGCGAMTEYDSGRPTIRINTDKVKTEKSLRKLMQHEMCHVAVFEAGAKNENDPHGPQWQVCMKRFE